MSIGRANLSQGGPIGTSAPFFSNPINQYDRVGFHTSLNSVEEWFDIPSVSTTHTRGSTSVIEIDRRGDAIGQIWLGYTRAVFATAPCIVNDWEIYNSIDNIRFLYNNKLVWSRTGEKMVLDILKMPAHEREALARLGGGDLSATERIAAAGIAQGQSADSVTSMVGGLWAKIPVPWSKDLRSLMWMVGLPNKIRVEIQWRPLAEMGCSLTSTANGTPNALLTGGAISDLTLRCKFYHVPESERTRFWQMSQSQGGLRLKTLTSEIQSRVLLTPNALGSAQQIAIRLTNIRNDVVALTTIVRSTPNVDGTTYYSNPWLFYPHGVYLRDSGSRVTNFFDYNNASGTTATRRDNTLIFNYTNAFLKYNDWVRAYPQAINTQQSCVSLLPFCPPSRILDSEHNCFGSRNIGRYNNPELVVFCPATDCTGGPQIGTAAPTVCSNGILVTATAQTFYVDIFAEVHNIIIQQEGDWRVYLL